jgi:hypothetical protein
LATQWQYTSQLGIDDYQDYDGLLLHSESSTGELIVALNELLEAPIAELTAAHELGHEHLLRLGYPHVTVDLPMLAPLASVFSSVLTDPLIDRWLCLNGYDARPLLEREFTRALKWSLEGSLESFRGSEDKDDSPAKTVEILRLLRLELSPWVMGWAKWSEFKERLASERPVWSTELLQLTSSMHEKDWYTPHGMRETLSGLLDHFEETDLELGPTLSEDAGRRNVRIRLSPAFSWLINY